MDTTISEKFQTIISVLVVLSIGLVASTSYMNMSDSLKNQIEVQTRTQMHLSLDSAVNSYERYAFYHKIKSEEDVKAAMEIVGNSKISDPKSETIAIDSRNGNIIYSTAHYETDNFSVLNPKLWATIKAVYNSPDAIKYREYTNDYTAFYEWRIITSETIDVYHNPAQKGLSFQIILLNKTRSNCSDNNYLMLFQNFKIYTILIIIMSLLGVLLITRGRLKNLVFGGKAVQQKFDEINDIFRNLTATQNELEKFQEMVASKEEQLKSSFSYQAKVLNAIPAMVIVRDPKTDVILNINRAACAWLEVDKEFALGKTLNEIMDYHTDAGHGECSGWLDWSTSDMKKTILRDGTAVRWIEDGMILGRYQCLRVTSAAVVDSDDEIIGIVGVAIDSLKFMELLRDLSVKFNELDLASACPINGPCKDINKVMQKAIMEYLDQYIPENSKIPTILQGVLDV